MEEGIIYIMTTVMQDLIKIGITEEKQYNERMRFLESNGYRQINGLRKLFAIKVSDYKAKERLLHDVFSQQRIGDTELFCLNPELVKGEWTSEEDFLIMYFYEQCNGSWKKIIPLFNGRTENSIKNRFFSQLRKIATKDPAAMIIYNDL